MTNPASFCYSSAFNVREYAMPTALFIAGPGNYLAPEFQDARAMGAEVYAYVRPISRLNVCKDLLELAYYMGNLADVPVWGNGRRNNENSVLTDIRVGSAWSDWLVEYVAGLILRGQVDGVFLDVLGCRPWGKLAAWDTWPEAERLEWTSGALDVARRIHEKRMELNPRFGILHNNVWQETNKSAPVGGDAYCSGVCLEHKQALVNGAPSFHAKYAGRQFAQDVPRRVLALAVNNADALAWSTVPGVTHVCAQAQYDQAEGPVVGYEDLRLPEAEAYIASLKARLEESSGNTALVAALTTQIESLQGDVSKSKDLLVAAWQAAQQAATVIKDSIV